MKSSFDCRGRFDRRSSWATPRRSGLRLARDAPSRISRAAARNLRRSGSCTAPAICTERHPFLAEDLLRAGGVLAIEYVNWMNDYGLPAVHAVGPRRHLDGATVQEIPGHRCRGARSSLLAGVHAGCYELFGNESVRAVRDLKGQGAWRSVPCAGADHVYRRRAFRARRHESRRKTSTGLPPSSHCRRDAGSSPTARPMPFLDSRRSRSCCVLRKIGTCHSQHCAGSPLVAVLLLLDRRP